MSTIKIGSKVRHPDFSAPGIVIDVCLGGREIIAAFAKFTIADSPANFKFVRDSREDADFVRDDDELDDLNNEC